MDTEREVGRFEAEDDEGNRYTVIEWQHIIISRPISGRVQEVPGVVRFALITGGHVEPKDDGSFQILDSDKIIRKVR